MSQVISRSSVLLLLATTVACIQPPPTPPSLVVTSPDRSTIQTDSGHVTVTGTATASDGGAAVTSVSVNDVPARVAADGSFTAELDVPDGITLLETVAMTADGGRAIDARAVQAGHLKPVGSTIPRAVTATLSKETFAKLSAAAGPLLGQLDLPGLLAPIQPMVSLGDDIANLKLSITKLALGNASFQLTPTDAGLMFSATVETIDVAAKADYAGALVPDGSTTVAIAADSITISGVLTVTPSGATGFTTSITSPNVTTKNLKLTTSGGLVGDILGLLDDNLGSTLQSVMLSALETEMTPLVNDALGALAGPKTLNVLGHDITLAASPSAVTFTSQGALVTIDLAASIAGSESSPGYVATTDGKPTLNAGSGVQLAVSDDLLNEMLAEVHALGMLDIKLDGDYTLFDHGDFNLTLPPMIDAHSTKDGSMRLVIGDMIANFSSQGKPVLSAALNAQIDLQVAPGSDANQVALQFGKVDVVVNFLDDPTGGLGGPEVSNAINAGIALQLDSLSKFLVTVPTPSFEGLTLGDLSLHGDSGYVVVGGQIE